MIRTLIVDDEPLAVRVLESHLEKVPDAEVVATATGGMEALELLRSEEVDLVFLDVEMPELSGVDLVEALADPPELVFVTAHRDYAAEGFELDAVDFLVKPVRLSRLVRAIEKYRRRAEVSTEGPSAGGARSGPTLNVRVDRQTVRLDVGAIRYVEGMSDYVKIHTAEKTHVTRRNISDLEDELAPYGFLRIHRSYLVALERVEAFTARSVEVADERLPVSRTYRERVVERLREE